MNDPVRPGIERATGGTAALDAAVDAGGGGEAFESMLARAPSAPATPASAARSDAGRALSTVSPGPGLEAMRAQFEAAMRSYKRAPDPVGAAKVAVLQHRYALSAQVTIKAIQRAGQALSELTRLQ